MDEISEARRIRTERHNQLIYNLAIQTQPVIATGGRTALEQSYENSPIDEVFFTPSDNAGSPTLSELQDYRDLLQPLRPIRRQILSQEFSPTYSPSIIPEPQQQSSLDTNKFRKNKNEIEKNIKEALSDKSANKPTFETKTYLENFYDAFYKNPSKIQNYIERVNTTTNEKKFLNKMINSINKLE